MSKREGVGSPVRKAGAVATKEDMDLVEQLQRAGKPPDLEAVQECHSCHLGVLERRTVLGVFTFYACTNEEGCCRMFWRKPRSPAAYRRPVDVLEH